MWDNVFIIKVCTWDFLCMYRTGCPMGQKQSYCKSNFLPGKMWEFLIFINFSPVQKQFLVIGGDSKNGTDREIQLINMEKDVFHSGEC